MAFAVSLWKYAVRDVPQLLTLQAGKSRQPTMVRRARKATCLSIEWFYLLADRTVLRGFDPLAYDFAQQVFRLSVLLLSSITPMSHRKSYIELNSL